jgi:hypothetical protein
VCFECCSVIEQSYCFQTLLDASIGIFGQSCGDRVLSDGVPSEQTIGHKQKASDCALASSILTL